MGKILFWYINQDFLKNLYFQVHLAPFAQGRHSELRKWTRLQNMEKGKGSWFLRISKAKPLNVNKQNSEHKY